MSNSKQLFPSAWDEVQEDGDNDWWNETKLVALDLDDDVSLIFKNALAQSCGNVRLLKVERCQSRRQWRNFQDFRKRNIRADLDDAKFLYHGTGARSPSQIVSHPDGLDPRVSSGFYGIGTYLAESPCYPIGGRYAHRVKGENSKVIQILVVRASLGRQQEMGQRVDAKTKLMRKPDIIPG